MKSLLPKILPTAVFLALASFVGAQEKTITIDTSKTTIKTSPLLYGIFFEEINRAGEGGIYAEMLQNCSFEDRNNVNEIRDTPLAWGVRNAEAKLDRSQPLNKNNLTSLKVKTQAGGFICNGGFIRDFNGRGPGSIAVTGGDAYDLTFFAKTGSKTDLKISFEEGSSTLASASVAIDGDTWKKYSVTLTPNRTARESILKIGTDAPAEFSLDMVSLFPQKTWKGRKNGLRPDLMERLVAMKPAFVRFPGGCFVEGVGLENRAIWKNSIGPVEERINQYNNNWGYNCSNGLGYHEYLQMCEDLGAEPLFVINCGMGHETRNGTDSMYVVPMEQMGPFVQDALDAIEYANGDVTTKWGAERAKNGHPAPFNMKYMEIGNENSGKDYNERYILMHKAIKEKYPEMRLIANVETQGFRNEIVDPHLYSTPDRFFNGYFTYDLYNRNDPQIYFGEYAVTQGGGRGNLIAAVAESAFMTGLERNSDIIIMSSYAPLFIRTGWQAWNPNAIVFDQNRSYGIPSYWAQVMFANNRPDKLYHVTIKDGSSPVDPIQGKIGFGTYRTQAEYKDIKVVKDGVTLFEPDLNNLDGWNQISGTWSAEGGILKQTSGNPDTLITCGSPDWTDYTLTLKARKISGSEGFLISFGVQNRELRRWNLGGWNNSTHAVEADDFIEEHLAGSIETGKWYDIKIELKGSEVNLYLDGKLMKTQKRLKGGRSAVDAGIDENAGEVILKYVNGTDKPVTYTINSGKTGAVGTVKTLTLTGDNPNAENSYEAPESIVPKAGSVQADSAKFQYTFPAYSVNILRWKK